jgi:hypothetical protein
VVQPQQVLRHLHEQVLRGEVVPRRRVHVGERGHGLDAQARGVLAHRCFCPGVGLRVRVRGGGGVVACCGVV